MPPSTPHAGLQFGGMFVVCCFGKDGNPLWSDRFPNGITNPALLSACNIMFRNATQLPNWYMAPITLVTTTAAADTLASHAGWTEVNANYDEADRPEWLPPAAAGGKLKNTATVVFYVQCRDLGGWANDCQRQSQGKHRSGYSLVYRTV